MRLQSLALLIGASVVAADSTVTLFLPGIAAPSIDGKILGSSGPMTTYLLNCPPGDNSSKCFLPEHGYTITEGGSTVIMDVSYGAMTITQTCKLQGSTYVNCFATETSDGSTSAITTGISIANMPYGGFMPVHITATETAGASASTGTTTTTSAKDTTLIGTVTSTGSGNTATAGASHSTNAAMPMITGPARWVVGGAAALAMAVA